jgi:hypothetical protein
MVTTSGVEAMPKPRIFHNPAAIEKWVKLIRQAEADADDKRVGSLINQGRMELNRTDMLTVLRRAPSRHPPRARPQQFRIRRVS